MRGKGAKQTAKKIAKYAGYGLAGFLATQALLTGAHATGLVLQRYGY